MILLLPFRPTVKKAQAAMPVKHLAPAPLHSMTSTAKLLKAAD